MARSARPPGRCGHGIARCVIRTTAVEIVPFDAVDADFAYDEGEGDRSLEYWRDAHWAYFTQELAGLGLEATHDMPEVCERFEVIYRAAGESFPAGHTETTP